MTDVDLPQPSPHPQFDQLVAVLAMLRAPGGCAWDAEQTHESLTSYLIEESHELIDAIETGSRDDILEELGDVLYQVLFHADIAAAHADAPFTIEDVAARTTAKMVGRHPHVFGDVVADSSAEVSANWELWKAAEKPARTSVLDGIPAGMPALARAEKLLGRAQRAGLEPAGDSAADDSAAEVTAMADEAALGEHLLAVVAAARARGLDAERALRSALRDLESRIREFESAPGSGSAGSGVVDSPA